MVTGNGTVGRIIHDLLLDELLDVEYYRDLEILVRALKVIEISAIRKLWCTFPIRLL